MSTKANVFSFWVVITRFICVAWSCEGMVHYVKLRRTAAELAAGALHVSALISSVNLDLLRPGGAGVHWRGDTQHTQTRTQPAVCILFKFPFFFYFFFFDSSCYNQITALRNASGGAKKSRTTPPSTSSRALIQAGGDRMVELT